MNATMDVRVDFSWDDEASVWTATSKDVTGLVLESGSLDALMERVKYAIPELLELNGKLPQTLRLTLSSKRMDAVALYG